MDLVTVHLVPPFFALRVEDPRVNAGASILPIELLLEIFQIGCAESQALYGKLLLLSKGINSLIRTQLLSVIPIRLQTEAQTESFHHFLDSNKELPQHIRHLWMVGSSMPVFRQYSPHDTPPEEAYMYIQNSIVRLTTNLKSISCSYHNFHHMCTWEEICNSKRYPCLEEVTILDHQTWSGTEFKLCKQIKHLALLDPTWPGFPLLSKLFPGLQALVLEVYMVNHLSLTNDSSLKEFSTDKLKHFPSCKRLVIAVVDNHTEVYKSIKLPRRRSAILRIGTMQYFKWWADRILGLEGILEEPH